MARILLRAHKNPFEVVSPRQTHKRNLIGDNVGNLLFSNASYKLLATRRSQVETAPLKGLPGEADRVNAEHDHVVIPLANAFRLSYADALERMTTMVRSLRVPVTVLGVGAQLNLDGSFERLEPMRESVKAFVSAVLDRSPSIGVRGEHTEAYLKALGFRDVEVIGCPSVFLHGPGHTVQKRARRLTRSSRISMNLSPYVAGLERLVEEQARRYPRLRYTAQHRDALGMLLDAGTRRRVLHDVRGDLPTHHGHPLVAGGRTSFFVDPQPWLKYLSGFDFSFGTRIHGNIAALVAGTPAYVFAHDSRTLELARYFDIPFRTTRRINPHTDAAGLYEEADFTAFNAGLRPRFERFAGFLAAHGLDHVYQEGEDPQAFDRRSARTPYPGDVRLRSGAAVALDPATILRRISRQARRPQAAQAA